jgi:hypothetical protein
MNEEPEYPQLTPEEEEQMHRELAAAQEERDRQADEYIAQGLCEHGKQHGDCADCKLVNEGDWYIWRKQHGKRMDDGYSW